MNLMRKFCGYVFALCTIYCIMLLPGMKVQAVDMTPVKPNEAFTGALMDRESVDYYSFTVDKQGYFTITFAPVDLVGNYRYGWQIDLYDGETGKWIADFSNLTTKYTIGKFDFRPGTKLYMAVSGLSWDVVGQEYSITINTVSDSSWEMEYNDAVSQANVIKANNTYYGNLYGDDDVDYFRYKVETTGTQTLSFSPVDMTLDPGDGWSLYIYDADTNELLKGWYDVTLKSTWPVMNFKKGTSLLIKICGDYDVPRRQDYCFSITEKKSSYWEGEDRQTESSWNGYRNGSTKLTFNRKYSGVLWTASDQDLFKLVLPKDGTINITFNPNEVSNNLGYGYQVCIKNSAGNDIVKSEHVKTKISKKYYLKKGTYYIHICSQWGESAVVNKIYTLSTTYKAYTPAQVTGLKAKKTVVSWKKQKDAEGYEVCYSKKKNFKGATVQKTTKGSLKLSDLKKGTTYYVRVRAYKTAADNTVVYGKWSSSVTVKK